MFLKQPSPLPAKTSFNVFGISGFSASDGSFCLCNLRYVLGHLSSSLWAGLEQIPRALGQSGGIVQTVSYSLLHSYCPEPLLILLPTGRGSLSSLSHCSCQIPASGSALGSSAASSPILLPRVEEGKWHCAQMKWSPMTEIVLSVFRPRFRKQTSDERSYLTFGQTS